jgi:hypothetical protein
MSVNERKEQRALERMQKLAFWKIGHSVTLTVIDAEDN